MEVAGAERKRDPRGALAGRRWLYLEEGYLREKENSWREDLFPVNMTEKRLGSSFQKWELRL